MENFGEVFENIKQTKINKNFTEILGKRKRNLGKKIQTILLANFISEIG